MPGGPAMEKIRAKLYEAQGRLCPYCGVTMPPPHNRDEHGRRIITLDHVYPRSLQPWRGHVGNLLLAHTRCNRIKDNRMPTPCEVLFLIAVNARVGSRLRMFEGDNPPVGLGRVPTPEERAAQSERDRARRATKLQAGPQSITIGKAARRPASLNAFDDFIEGYRGIYDGPDLGLRRE